MTPTSTRVCVRRQRPPTGRCANISVCPNHVGPNFCSRNAPSRNARTAGGIRGRACLGEVTAGSDYCCSQVYRPVQARGAASRGLASTRVNTSANDGGRNLQRPQTPRRRLARCSAKWASIPKCGGSSAAGHPGIDDEGVVKAPGPRLRGDLKGGFGRSKLAKATTTSTPFLTRAS
jgi:hypothetical protein